MIEVVLRAVRVDVGSSTPLLLLEEVGGERVLPIYIGAPEAASGGPNPKADHHHRSSM